MDVQGGVYMAASSITKEFYVKDQIAFERLKTELATKSAPREKVVESPSLKRGKEKLATFVFR